MKKMAVLLSSFVILILLGISVNAAFVEEEQMQMGMYGMAGDSTLIITVYYGDGETPCDNATIELSRNSGGYSRTLSTNENGDPVTVAGVPEGLYTVHAYRVHPQYGKQIGIIFWGEVTNNNLNIPEGETVEIDLVLQGGLYDSFPAQAPAQAPSQAPAQLQETTQQPASLQ